MAKIIRNDPKRGYLDLLRNFLPSGWVGVAYVYYLDDIIGPERLRPYMRPYIMSRGPRHG